MIVVADASVLIALARIGHLDILPTLFGRVFIPRAVAQEIEIGGKAGSKLFKQASWIYIVDLWSQELADELSSANRKGMKLDEGEAQAIALALELDADYLLIDERRGRRVAESLGIDLIGVLGVLALAKRKGLLPEIRPALDALLRAGFRISNDLYRFVLEDADEAS